MEERIEKLENQVAKLIDMQSDMYKTLESTKISMERIQKHVSDIIDKLTNSVSIK